MTQTQTPLSLADPKFYVNLRKVLVRVCAVCLCVSINMSAFVRAHEKTVLSVGC